MTDQQYTFNSVDSDMHERERQKMLLCAFVPATIGAVGTWGSYYADFIRNQEFNKDLVGVPTHPCMTAPGITAQCATRPSFTELQTPMSATTYIMGELSLGLALLGAAATISLGLHKKHKPTIASGPSAP